MSVSEILNRAADLIEKPGAWTKGELARVSPRGEAVATADDRARCWCIEGALKRTAEFAGASRCLTEEAYQAVRRVVGTDFIYEWNDKRGRKQSEVVAALRQAARKASDQSQEGGAK